MSEPDAVDHDAETQCGATELGVAIVETGPQLAYSAELPALDYPEPVSRLRVGLIAAGIVMAAAVAVGAVLVVGRTRHEAPAAVALPTSTTAAPTEQPLGASLPPAPPPPASLPTVTTVIVQAPPSVITKSAPVPTPAAPQWVSIYDQQLFNRLAGQGVNIMDYGSMARDAHLICARLANGRTVASVTDEYAQASRGNYVIAQLFVSDVMAIYPSCP